MWVMKADRSAPPTPLGYKIHEGVAISRTRLRIAWSNSHQQYPDRFEEGESALYVADIVYDGGVPHLANKKEIIRAHLPDCTLEAQDFRYDDTQLIYTCYRENGNKADVMGVDLARARSRRTARSPTNTTRPRASRPTAMGARGVEPRPGISRAADVSLHRHLEARLEANGTDFMRMTRFGDFDGRKAANPVVSPDGGRSPFRRERRAIRRA